MTFQPMISLSVRGDKVVQHVMKEIAPREAANLMRATVGAVTSEIMKDAKKNMNFSGPYSVGLMKKMTGKRRKRVRGGILIDEIVVGKPAFYWRFYEYGDAHNPKIGMFRDALMKMNSHLDRRVNEIFMKKLIARLARVRKQNLQRIQGGRR